MKGDYPAGTTANPLHVVLTVLPDGTINPSVGVVFAARLPSGTEHRVDVEIPLAEALSPDWVTALTWSLGKVFAAGVAKEGIEALAPRPEPNPAPTQAPTPG